MKGTNYNPFVNEHFIGFINQVTPQGVKVHFPSSALLQPFFKYGELYHGGLVGNYVVIEGHQMGFLGKIQGIELPEKERLELSEKSFETNEMHPIGYIEILLSFSFENPEEIQRGLNTLPPIGAKVFVCASYFIQSFFKRFGVKKENTAPCLMKLGVLTQDKTTPVEISLDALFGRHCAIVGTTGGGKSYTTSKLLEGISNAKAKAIIIDPTGEYSGFDSKDYVESAISKRIYQSEQTKSGIPFYKISDFPNLIEYGYSDTGIFISQAKYEELKSQKLVPNESDLLITSRGTLGLCYIVKDEDCFYFQDGMITWLKNLKSTVLSAFLGFMFQSSLFKNQIEKAQNGSTIAYLSIAMIRKFDMIVPPIKLQQHFVSQVEAIEKQKELIRDQLAETETLMAERMQYYFS